MLVERMVERMVERLVDLEDGGPFVFESSVEYGGLMDRRYI